MKSTKNLVCKSSINKRLKIFQRYLKSISHVKKKIIKILMEKSWRGNRLLVLFGFLHTMLPFNDDSDEKKQDDTSLVQAAENSVEDELSKLKLPRNLPSILEIKKAIPPHCFESSLSTSLYYMAKDFLMVLIVGLLCEWTWHALPLWTQFLITPAFWLTQGTLFTALFVVGHDAGHGSFSNYEMVNVMCGNICHAFILCPFYMWKLSHRKHHKNTGNIDKDEVFYPVRKRDNNNPYLLPGFGLFIGWIFYLIKGYRPRQVEHFNPLHPMFRSHVMDCMLSLLMFTVWCGCLYRFAETFGWGYLLYHHTVPTCVFGCYIVIITFLHHTEDDIPWYDDQLWENVRGQLSSIDRHYGWCHNLIHNIGTHQIHHLFPKVPHYHLEEATVAFRKAFPKLVAIRTESILPAYIRMFKKYEKQSVIDDDAMVHVYK